MRKQTWQTLDEFFADSPELKSEKVALAEIAAAEREVGVTLAADYKEFIHRYGGAIVGRFPIFGLRRAEEMGQDDSSFLKVTKFYREQHWPGTEKWAVISTDYDGNPVGLDAEGKVWISDHDARAIQLLSSNLEMYLREWCLKLPD
ncbi:MAG TPA: SMI1/KNR4 family protein [Verrucomicrobiae bacterium]|jgi:hypothetical protein